MSTGMSRERLPEQGNKKGPLLLGPFLTVPYSVGFDFGGDEGIASYQNN
jgi:hypothetical protein